MPQRPKARDGVSRTDHYCVVTDKQARSRMDRIHRKRDDLVSPILSTPTFGNGVGSPPGSQAQLRSPRSGNGLGLGSDFPIRYYREQNAMADWPTW